MALVVFLRGINVGGHRRFRPSLLARELSAYGVVNIGAAGTFVVRRPGPHARFRAALRRRLPFVTEVVLCGAGHLTRLAQRDPFDGEPRRRDRVRFLSVLSRPPRRRARAPLAIPAGGRWFVRIIAVKGQFVVGVYRRHMKTIGYLGQIDKLFGAPATTRSWTTILAILRILEGAAR